MKKRGILFLSGGWTVGGIERVTVTLANEFVSRGIPVVVCFYVLLDDQLLSCLDKRVKVQKLSCRFRCGFRNISAIRRLILDHEIGYILNAYRLNVFFKLICLFFRVRQLSCLHSKPDTNGKVVGARFFLTKFFWQVATRIKRIVSYYVCDATVLLSESYVSCFKHLIFARNCKKVHVIQNPLTIDPICCGVKENKIIYVGRMTENPKRVSRVLEIWHRLHMQLPDWQLDLLGDGADRLKYEADVKDLPRIFFHGAVDPRPFYSTAKIVLLVSDYEGWPLVIIEGMAHGCVPVVYASFDSAYDIIANDKSGVLVDPPFCVEEWVRIILSLAANDNKIKYMSVEARRSMKEFEVSVIADRWLRLMEDLK